MKITPLDIQQQTFRNALLKGYDTKEVDEFLDLVKEELEKLVLENNRLKEDLKRNENRLLEFQAREKVLKDTMITAQKITEDIKETAKKDGQLVISQAEIQSEKIIRAAQDRLSEIMDDINEMKRQKVMFETSIRSLVDKHYKLLEIASDDEVKGMGIENKITFLPK